MLQMLQKAYRFVFADPFGTISNKAQLFINAFIFVEFSYISDLLTT